jgi:excisionase family DNA binding protein
MNKLTTETPTNDASMNVKATSIEPSLQGAQPAPLPEVLTVLEVASLLRCDRKTVYEAIRRRNLPHQKISARALRFSRDAVLQWLRSGQWRTYHKTVLRRTD